GPSNAELLSEAIKTPGRYAFGVKQPLAPGESVMADIEQGEEAGKLRPTPREALADLPLLGRLGMSLSSAAGGDPLEAARHARRGEQGAMFANLLTGGPELAPVMSLSNELDRFLAMTPAKRINKLAYASGGTGTIADDLKAAFADLKNAARRTGREPKNPAQYLQNIRDAMRPLNNEYGVNLQQVAGEIHVPTKVSDMLRAEAASLPEVAADEASQLRDLATSYEKPRTIRDMDRERMWRNAKADAFYKKGELGQMNADQAAASAYIHKKIADGLR